MPVPTRFLFSNIFFLGCLGCVYGRGRPPSNQGRNVLVQAGLLGIHLDTAFFILASLQMCRWRHCFLGGFRLHRRGRLCSDTKSGGSKPKRLLLMSPCSSHKALCMASCYNTGVAAMEVDVVTFNVLCCLKTNSEKKKDVCMEGSWWFDSQVTAHLEPKWFEPKENNTHRLTTFLVASYHFKRQEYFVSLLRAIKRHRTNSRSMT